MRSFSLSVPQMVVHAVKATISWVAVQLSLNLASLLYKGRLQTFWEGIEEVAMQVAKATAPGARELDLELAVSSFEGWYVFFR